MVSTRSGRTPKRGGARKEAEPESGSESDDAPVEVSLGAARDEALGQKRRETKARREAAEKAKQARRKREEARKRQADANSANKSSKRARKEDKRQEEEEEEEQDLLPADLLEAAEDDMERAIGRELEEEASEQRAARDGAKVRRRKRRRKETDARGGVVERQHGTFRLVYREKSANPTASDTVSAAARRFEREALFGSRVRRQPSVVQRGRRTGRPMF